MSKKESMILGDVQDKLGLKFNRGGFLKYIRSIDDDLGDARIGGRYGVVPDSWVAVSSKVEWLERVFSDWQREVEAVVAIEVEDTHHMPEHKLCTYGALGFAMDSVCRDHELVVVRINRHGTLMNVIPWSDLYYGHTLPNDLKDA